MVGLEIHGGAPQSVRAPEPEAFGVVHPPARANPFGFELAIEELAVCERAKVEGLGLYRIDKLFRKGLSSEVFHGLPILEDIQELGRLIALHPTWETYNDGPEEQVIQFLFASNMTEAELSQVLFDPLIVLHGPRPHPEDPGRTTLRFLIVEDDPTAGGLMQYILRQHGDCVLRDTGEAGLVAFREAFEREVPFDLVVLDLFLPDLSGHEVLKEIRASEFQRGIQGATNHCIVLINTASKDLDEMRKALEAEPDGYLIKPIKVDVILARIATLKAERLHPTNA